MTYFDYFIFYLYLIVSKLLYITFENCIALTFFPKEKEFSALKYCINYEKLTENKSEDISTFLLGKHESAHFPLYLSGENNHIT